MARLIVSSQHVRLESVWGLIYVYLRIPMRTVTLMNVQMKVVHMAARGRIEIAHLPGSARVMSALIRAGTQFNIRILRLAKKNTGKSMEMCAVSLSLVMKTKVVLCQK